MLTRRGPSSPTTLKAPATSLRPSISREARAADVSGLGQVPRARNGAWTQHRRQARCTRQIRGQLHGRRRIRDDGAGLRDGRPQQHTDPHHSAQQLHHGYRDNAYGPIP